MYYDRDPARQGQQGAGTGSVACTMTNCIQIAVLLTGVGQISLEQGCREGTRCGEELGSGGKEGDITSARVEK